MTADRVQFLRYAKRVARKLPSTSVGAFTGIIGELLACDAMHVKWEPREGFDARTRKGQRISIKTRVIRRDRDLSPTMGTFHRNKGKPHGFDLGWFVQLNEDFELEGIWEAPKRTVARLQAARKNRGIAVAKFKREENSRRVWPKTNM